MAGSSGVAVLAPCGRFESRRAALGSAVQDAERVQRLGHRVRVFVRRADGRLRHLPGTPRIRPPDDAVTSPSPPSPPSPRRREALSRR
jgi:hypothetical protein